MKIKKSLKSRAIIEKYAIKIIFFYKKLISKISTE